jgi:hypothetical protein
MNQDEAAHAFIEKLRARSSNDKRWVKFKDWMTSSKLGRSTGRRITSWSKLTPPDVLGSEFAFGFERFEEYVLSAVKTNDARYLDVVNEAYRCGVFDRSEFAKLPSVPRLALYCHDDEVDSFFNTHGSRQPLFQRTVVVVETRPMHLSSENSLITRWARQEVWDELFESYDGNTIAPDINFASHLLTRTLLSAVMDERVDDWSAHFQEVGRHLGMLESHVYEHSSDDSHSTDLWSLSKHLIEARALVSQHASTTIWAQAVSNTFATTQWAKAVAESEDEKRWNEEREKQWLHEQHNELKNIADSVQNEYLEIIDHLIDLMYKSVSIRDARLSLELNASLWRLSWITFIFLPLTFLVGFFGMNVDTFVRDAPSLKWYFVAAVPLMIFIFMSWMTFKNLISDSRGLPKRLGQKKDRKINYVAHNAI